MFLAMFNVSCNVQCFLQCFLAHQLKIGSLGEVPAEQPIGGLIGTPLPGSVMFLAMFLGSPVENRFSWGSTGGAAHWWTHWHPAARNSKDQQNRSASPALPAAEYAGNVHCHYPGWGIYRPVWASG